MSKKFLFLSLSLLLFMSINVKANSINIDKRVQKIIDSLGIDLESVEFKEIKPRSFNNYDKYSKEEYSFQKDSKSRWSTILNVNITNLNLMLDSSSALEGYPTKNIFDKKIDTSWVEGVKGSGIGEWVSVEFTPIMGSRKCPTGFQNIAIISGYLKNNKIWEENNRVKSLILVKERFDYRGNEHHDYVMYRLKLQDYKGLQIFDLTSGEFPSLKKKIWIIIEDIYKATKYDDTCISEIVLDGQIPVGFFEP